MVHPFSVVRLGLLLLLLAIAGSAWADTGKELFDKQCAGCHTIGGGDGGGPDLKGVGARRSSEWLVKVITAPDKLAAAKDPAQLELVKKFGMEMPNLGVSQEDAAKIAAMLQGGASPAKAGTPKANAAAGAAGTASTAATTATPAAEAGAEAPKQTEVVVTKELLATGRDLFTGKQRFAKGGAACVSCHSLNYPGINGGVLAVDLTRLYVKMGENGVRGLLSSLSFPIMKKIYADRPLSDDEKTALLALFKEAGASKRAASDPYPLAGLGFFTLCIVGLMIFKRRIK